MAVGFIITRLQLTGPNVQPAFVILTAGLNVISGPSNTGKTYIFQCINYMLGGSEKPKRIIEALSYAHCYLEIQTATDRVITLKSDLNGGDFQLYQCALDALGQNREYQTLSRKHNDGDPNSISTFFLSLCNLESKKVKINAQGKKRGVSFRDLTKLQLVDEVRIITDKSPITTGQYTTDTVEKSILKLLITGDDDSALIETLSKDEIKHRRGKVEMLSELIGQADGEANKLQINDYEEAQITRIDESISTLNKELRTLSEIQEGLTLKKITQQNLLSKESSNRDELALVRSRSAILSSQYDSDLARLQSTIEACEMLNSEELKTTDWICPVCQSVISTSENTTDLEAVFKACTKEAGKIELLKNELSLSQVVIEEEINNSNEKIANYIEQIRLLEIEIKERVENRINKIVDSINSLTALRDTLNQYKEIQNRKKELVRQRDAIAGTIVKTKSTTSSDGSVSSFIFPLCEAVSNLLSILKYPGLKGVSFNEDKDDFVISGQDRQLAGKGFRAITYSAFVIALHQLVSRHGFSLPIPIIDSLLVTYRKPNSDGEDISVDLAMDFYRYMAKSNLSQVIIMENEEPPVDIEPVINHIIFTQSTNGRYGFIPPLE